MSDKAEELAKQLLEKTEGAKLNWLPADGFESDAFRSDVGDGFVFSIQRSTTGTDGKVISLQLKKGGNIVFTDQVDNYLAPRSSEAAFMAGPVDIKIVRFRLFSDLFHAARRSAMGGDRTIEKVQQLLERLG
jgi:hypothetical protein